MIIFFNKKTGDIVGAIEGRIHSQEHFNMWVGGKNETDRIVVNWKPVKWYNQKGEIVSKDSPDVFTADFEPEHSQKDLFILFDEKPVEVYNYKVDLKTKQLVKK